MSAGLDPRIRWQRAIAGATDLPRSTRQVAVFLGCHLNAQLLGGVALAVLVAETGYSRDTVLRALRRLKAGGWIEVAAARRRGRATVYRAELPALWARNEVAAELPDDVYEVAPVPPHPLPRPVDKADEVAAVLPRPLIGVAPLPPQAGNEVAPVPPLLYVGKDVRTGSPVDNGGAARAVDEVAVGRVIGALTPRLRPRTPAHLAGYRTAIAQRLAAGWTVEQLQAAEPTHGPAELSNPVGWWARQVALTPPAIVVPAAPLPRCTRYGHEHATVTAAGGCAACRIEALAVSS